MARLDRVRRELEESIELGLATTPVDVIVMGPSLAENSPAARLRREIIRAAGEYGASIKPEHKDLVATASAQLGEGHSLTAYEIHLVDISHLVVLIPASPGSLCELGLFSYLDKFSQKMLILASTEFPRSGSYVADGPLTYAEHKRIEVVRVDYSDFNSAWSPVQTRLQRIRVARNLARLTGEAGPQ